ncbi:Gamma-glutamyl-hercynylcysteine sulfoxide hydrolase [Capillimicrobium parvum]|uniref:Gamma-glutamyl-hercynylcysteine sulfoxide hydrolase n=2 Tax=Capillimicrobium parvum TaxID=2884022 RepID=A0A9E7C054_9ACTN|nr:Gamma-glutamyl-hercynylcysteine sulfoxide hydrolase [Capillimicrobium parvum]
MLAYLGEPVSLRHILFETDGCLVRQSYSPRMMNTFLNLAGFGMAAWQPQSVREDEPFIYRTTTLPAFDRNLRGLAGKLEPTCAIAHVRGVTYGEQELVGGSNLHPFRFPGATVALAHNGHLRDFSRMRYDLVRHIRPELAERIEGTTDSEWIYALVLSHLDDPYGVPEAGELAEAAERALGVLREVRARLDIDTSSPVNLFITTGQALVATRFSFDYGWYPADDTMLETDLPYVSLWYTAGDSYGRHDGDTRMAGDRGVRSLLIASEPLTEDTSTWLEVPEYSMIMADRASDALALQMRDLDV